MNDKINFDNKKASFNQNFSIDDSLNKKGNSTRLVNSTQLHAGSNSLQNLSNISELSNSYINTYRELSGDILEVKDPSHNNNFTNINKLLDKTKINNSQIYTHRHNSSFLDNTNEGQQPLVIFFLKINLNRVLDQITIF